MNRILSVVERLSVGGIEDSLLMLCKNINRDQFRMEVCTLYDRGPLADEFEALGVPVHNLALNHRNYPANTLRIARFLRRHKFDIVHVQVVGPALATRLGTRLAGVPGLIVSIQNTYLQRSWLERLLDRWLAYFTDCIVANSNAVKAFTTHQERISPDRFRVIHSSVDVNRFDPRLAWGAKVRQELGISSSHTVIGMVASLTEQKGHIYLLMAAAQILQRWPQVVLLIVGDGPLHKQLQEMVDQTGIAGRVIFSPSRRDLPNVLAAIDIFVAPSLWEGFSLVILDAMAMQKAIVASDIPSISEAVVDGVCGSLVPPRDPEALADKINLLLSSPDLRIALGEAARQRAVEMFSVEVFVTHWEEFYRDSSGESGKGRCEFRYA